MKAMLCAVAAALTVGVAPARTGVPGPNRMFALKILGPNGKMS